MLRLVSVLAAALLIGGCTNPNDLDEAPVALGDFALGHNIVVAPHPVKGPVSREASPDEWIASLSSAIGDRFDRYQGSKFYHLGVSVDGYVLAQPGIPVVLSPKSVLIINVTVWDDALNKKLNEKPETITVLESLSGETVVGSGLTQSAEQQMENLSRNASKMIENWLVRQNKQEGWFKHGPAAPAPRPAASAAAPAPTTTASPAAAVKKAATSSAPAIPPAEVGKIHAVGPVIE